MNARLQKTYAAGGRIMDLAPAPQLRLPLEGRHPMLADGTIAPAHTVIAAPAGPAQLPLFTPFAGHVRIEGQTVVVDQANAPHGQRPAATNAKVSLLTWPGLSGLLREHAIAGLGGGGFPVHQKLVPGLKTLIVNAVECEPGVSADQALLEARAPELVNTFAVLVDVLQPAEHVFAIAADNLPAQDLLGAAGAEHVAIAPAGHAAGSERQLVQALTGVNLARGERPAARGIACINLGTLSAIADVLLRGLPLTTRVVTVSGTSCTAPGNYRIPFGTPFAHVANELGRPGTPGAIRMGGVMTGRWTSANSVVNHSTLAIELMSSGPTADGAPCIRCSHCGPVCPENLQPWRLLEVLPSATRSSADARGLGLDACLLCGACSVVCPSHLPLNDLFSAARATSAEEAAGDASAARAKARYERHTARHDERSADRAERLRARRKRADAASLIARARSSQT